MARRKGRVIRMSSGYHMHSRDLKTRSPPLGRADTRRPTGAALKETRHPLWGSSPRMSGESFKTVCPASYPVARRLCSEAVLLTQLRPRVQVNRSPASPSAPFVALQGDAESRSQPLSSGVPSKRRRAAHPLAQLSR